MLRLEPIGATLAATAACFAVSGLWFSPAMFGKAWLRELHVTDAGGRATGALAAIPASLIAALALGTLTASAHATSVLACLAVALIVWTAFAAIQLPAVLLERTPRRFSIDAGHKLAAYTVMCIVFGLWNQ